MIKPSFVIAIVIAGIVQLLSMTAAKHIIDIEPMYAYYVVIFLICFGWYTTAIKLHLYATQIVSGLAVVLLSISVLDCYFADGYETLISMMFPCIMTIINILTLVAAYYDRNRFDSYRIGRVWGASDTKAVGEANKCR